MTDVRTTAEVNGWNVLAGLKELVCLFTIGAKLFNTEKG